MNVGESGANATKFAISGMIAYNVFDSEAIAYIEDTATIDAGGNLSVHATTDTLAVIVAGGIVKSGGQAGLGATIVINDISATTKAFIGDFDPNAIDSTGPGMVDAGGMLSVKATNTEKLINVAIAGTVASGGNMPMANESKADDPNDPLDGESLPNLFGEPSTSAANTQQKGGLGISGAVAINDSTHTTHAFVSGNTSVDADGAVEVIAMNDAFAVIVSGAAALDFSKSTGGVSIAGSFTLNDLTRDVQAYIEDVTLEGASVMISADAIDDLISVTAGGAGGKLNTNLSVMGSADVNLIDVDVIAAIRGTADVTSTNGDVNSAASSELELFSLAGGFATAGKAGIGAAVDVGVLDFTVHSYISGTAKVTADNDIVVTANSTEDIIAIGASLVLSKNLGVSGSGAGQGLTTNVQAYIDTTMPVKADGDILIDASDDAEMILVGGSAAIGKQNGIGAAVAAAHIDRTVKAYVGAGADVTALGSGTSISDPSGTLSGNGLLIDATATDGCASSAPPAPAGATSHWPPPVSSTCWTALSSLTSAPAP